MKETEREYSLQAEMRKTKVGATALCSQTDFETKSIKKLQKLIKKNKII